jgi:CO/xanthine dehydrogenase FAD-binding subunit
MSDHPDYIRATSLSEALSVLADRAVTIAAGCTDLFPATERKILPGPVLDITGLPELRGVTRVSEGLRIGACTTWSDLIAADLPAACDGLKLAAREVGARQIQNRATLGGNLCNASPAADGVPPLLSLDAEVELAAAHGTRRVSLASYLTGPRQTVRQPDELLSAVILPDTALTGQGHFLKLGAREYLVISIAMVAVRLHVEAGIVRAAAIAVGSCSPVAARLPELEAALVGQSVDDLRIDPELVTQHLAPIADVRADANYRLNAAHELVTRCIRAARPKQVAA